MENKKSLKEKWKEYQSKAKEEKRRVDLISELVMNWQNTFANLKKWNEEKKGYTLHSIEVKDYGFSCRIYAPWGINLFELDKFKSIIESGLKCEFIYTVPQHHQFAMAKFVYPDQVKINQKPFVPINVKPWEIFVGYDVSGEPVIFNVNDTPHALIAGQQRRGKNGSADHAIISLIHSCDETEVTFYLFQGAKNDFIKYKDCKQVYCYTDNIYEIAMALDHLEQELLRRTKLFEPMVARAEGNDNIFHYNKLHPHNKLPYIYVIIDEFIELMPDNKVDEKELKDLKNMIMKRLRQIGQWGGSLGINYIPLHQKPEKELMPTFIKNQSSIRICFGFEDLICCSIVLGDELAKYAHKLPQRKAYYSNNETSGYLYTSDLKGRIRQFIEPSIDPKHRTLFDDLKKLKKDFRTIQSTNPQTNNNGTTDTQPTPPMTNTELPNLQNIEEIIKRTMEAQLKTSPKKTTEKEKEVSATKSNESTKETIQNESSKLIIPQPKVKSEEEIIPIKFDKVDPEIKTKEVQELHENIKAIDNFVPYIDYSKFKKVKIIDQTKISSKTEKPKKNKE